MPNKYALIIGNTEYTDAGLAKLTAPGKDAEDFARVLKSVEIEVVTLVNENASSLNEAIEDFFTGKKSDDLLVFYFSGHGVRDESGALFLAVKNTNRSKLRSTAIKADFVRDLMDQSRSRRQVIILDCCNSGAFAQGTKAETGGTMGIARTFEGTGYGRVILTATDATQFAWEGDKIIGDEVTNSLFTHFLVKGLEGEADKNGDGRITVDELYDYAYEQIVSRTPKQTPGKWSYKQQGDIALRQSTRIEQIKPIPLPDDLINEIEDPRPYLREAAVQRLEKILKGKSIGLAHSARAALEKIAAEDDSRRVAQAAAQILDLFKQAELEEKAKKESEESANREQAEREAAERAEHEKARQESARLAAQKVEEQRLAQAKVETERKAKQEADRLAAQKSEDERVAHEKVEAEREAKQEADRIVAQKAEEERLAQAKIESERKAKQDADRLAAQKVEQRRLAKQKAEEERLAQAKVEADSGETKEKADRLSAQKDEPKKPVRISLPVMFGGLGLLLIVGLFIVGVVLANLMPATTTDAPTATSAPTKKLVATKPPTSTRVRTATVVPTKNKPVTTQTLSVFSTKYAPTSAFNIGSTMKGEDGATLLYVPGGEFTMGSPASSPSFSLGSLQKSTVHIVYLNAFWIDQTEATNAMYAKCVAAKKCNPPNNTTSNRRPNYYGNSYMDNYPVIHVDWSMAKTYCEWAGRRLPTEAEWEKAARGMDARTYPWGNDAPNEDLLNYTRDTTEVGKYPNGKSFYGAYDMAGNVWEWVNDWYSDIYYQSSPLTNPLGPDSGTLRVVRGGSWVFGSDVRSASRNKYTPDNANGVVGFRCALSP